MNIHTRTKLYDTLRAVLKDRSDHDIAQEDQREVVLDALAVALEKEFQIRPWLPMPPSYANFKDLRAAETTTVRLPKKK